MFSFSSVPRHHDWLSCSSPQTAVHHWPCAGFSGATSHLILCPGVNTGLSPAPVFCGILHWDRIASDFYPFSHWRPAAPRCRAHSRGCRYRWSSFSIPLHISMPLHFDLNKLKNFRCTTSCNTCKFRWWNSLDMFGCLLRLTWNVFCTCSGDGGEILYHCWLRKDKGTLDSFRHASWKKLCWLFYSSGSCLNKSPRSGSDWFSFYTFNSSELHAVT